MKKTQKDDDGQAKTPWWAVALLSGAAKAVVSYLLNRWLNDFGPN
ncbi:hypothetical protein Q8791_27245 [Nocardiopsis sp. CT-R113]|uniref:Uncharacterized protein n=1 Tax=Nocardiopsis codii TaxID=3065942 RepID=A0ABU7KFD6_9ACTN|nr:hypothetical protein [Nocardiopsis sp. CT-R113]MEE2040922.1 hypothetical protein [Nocardiopsis sp. CT-R113]